MGGLGRIWLCSQPELDQRANRIRHRRDRRLLSAPMVDRMEHALIESDDLLDGIKLRSPPRHGVFSNKFVYALLLSHISHISKKRAGQALRQRPGSNHRNLCARSQWLIKTRSLSL